MKSVAIVVPDLRSGGGVPVVAEYFFEILKDHYRCEFVSLCTSARDANSVLITSPNTWFSGVQISQFEWRGVPAYHVGAWGAEFEPCRYFSRKALTTLLNGFDYVQLVCGSPCWGGVLRDVQSVKFMQVASLVTAERQIKRSKITNIFKKAYFKLIDLIVSQQEFAGACLADCIFVENQWMFDRMCGWVGKGKVVHSKPGIDTEIFKKSIKVDKSLVAPDVLPPYIISVGRFSDARKNIPVMIRALADLHKRFHSSTRLLLVGVSEPTEHDWHLAESLNVRYYIQYMKNIERQDLIDLLSEAILFVSSSDEEGLGIAMLEAMACSCPVVSTRSGGPEEFIRHEWNGLLVEKGNHKELAAAIFRVLNERQLRQSLSENATETIRKYFSKNATSSAFLNVYAHQPVSSTPFGG